VSSGSGLSSVLDRLVSIQNSAYTSASASIHIDLKSPATDEDLDRVEARTGRYFADEVRELYRWHDGCAVFLVPDISFRGLRRSLDRYLMVGDFQLPQPSNFTDRIEPIELFPVLDRDRVALPVMTTSKSRQPTSPLFLLDFEMDQLTMVARSLTDFVEFLLHELERGNYEMTKYGLQWRRPPPFSRDMTPIGEVHR
jgi:hypothetical protein